MAPRVDLTSSELTTGANTPTDADIAAFQRGDQERALDFQAYMEGSNRELTPAERDSAAVGMTTDNGEFHQPPDTTERIPLIQHSPQQAPPYEPQAPGQDYQRLYGQSENEKGELRRALQQQMDANSQLLGQVQQLVNQPQYTQPYPTPQPNNGYYDQSYNNGNGQGYSYAPTTISQGQPQYVQPPRLPQRFSGKQDGEMVLSEDLEQTMQQYVAPAYFTLHQDTQRALGEAAQLRQMLVQSEKERRGITPQLEAQALVQQPWLRNLQSNPNPQPYLGALSTYAQSQHNAALLQRTAHPQLAPTPTPPALMPGTAAAAGRRITYVEGSNSPSTAFEPGNQQTSFEREMEQAMSEKHLSKRAVKMREVMARHGINQTNDWRDPAVTTR